MRMLMMQVSTCIGSLAALVLRYTFGTSRRAGKHRIDVDHAICGAGVSTVSLRTHHIMALGDEDLPAACQSGPSLRILRD